MNKKIFVIGGHMAPALGFIEALPKDISVVYVGRKHPFEGDSGTSLEYETVTRLKIPFIPLTTGRLQRKFTSQTVPSLVKIPQGFFQALQILKKEKPDAVVAFGGYLSVPIGIAAKVLGIPLILHESTFAAGLANRLLAPFAQKICLSADSSRAYFPNKKTVLTGNPLLPFHKTTITDYLPSSKEGLPLFVIVGGSAGSHAINSLVFHSLPELLSFARVVHQTGDSREFRDYEKAHEVVLSLEKRLQNRYKAIKYIEPEKVNSVLHMADIVISRAGFNTVMALLLLKKKSILIPLPFGQKNEQQENAKLFVNSGYGSILSQKGLTKEAFIATIKQVLHQKIVASKQFAIPLYPNGAENLVEQVLLCLKHHTDDLK